MSNSLWTTLKRFGINPNCTESEKSQNYRKARQECQEPTWTVVAISNVPWLATTVEGPFDVGAGGIFATIVRVVQALVRVWVYNFNKY